MRSSLPSTIKAEVKLTTASGVQVSARELDALKVADPAAAGLLAVLFWCGDREVDGRWVIVDASRIRDRCAESFSATKAALLLASRTQDGFGELRRHVDGYWPAFLDAFKEEALRDHAALVEALAQCHREGLVSDRLPKHAILAAEHRATIRQVIDVQGESDAGRIMQDLLAYLLAFAGYRKVTNNPVGVPDFVLSDLVSCAATADGPLSQETVVIELRRDEAERLLELCRSAGDDALARTVSRFGRI
jgi:hypothetical protein